MKEQLCEAGYVSGKPGDRKMSPLRRNVLWHSAHRNMIQVLTVVRVIEMRME